MYVSINGVTPIAGWFGGKSENKNDDLGVASFHEPPYGSVSLFDILR
jgi:hypothetical protein